MSLLTSFHRPIQSVETHFSRPDNDFFYCTLFGGQKSWISRVDLTCAPYTANDRDTVEKYCIQHRLMPIHDLTSYVQLDQIELEHQNLSRTINEPIKKRKPWWKCCFKQ